jgi:hypothetical protein
MPISYPGNCKTNVKRNEYLLIRQEKLRLMHNAVGKWYREGITQAEYDDGINLVDPHYDPPDIVVQLPSTVKTLAPYKAQLNETEWIKFKNNWWEPRQAEVVAETLKYRKLICQSSTWTPDLD